MAENNNNSEFKVEIDKEELKNQTKETVNQVKETVKNINFKEDAKATKGFVLELISKPVTTIKNIVAEKENHFSSAVILMICYIVLSIVYYMTLLSQYNKFKLMPAIQATISPVLYLLSFTAAVFLFGGKNKKNITTIISALAIAMTPMIAIEALSVVYGIFVYKLDISIIGNLITILNSGLRILSATLMFTAIKELITSEESEDSTFRKFAIIITVAFAILEVFNLIGLY